MDGMREILRGNLGRSLSALRDEDRLAAAWTVACGLAMAEHGTVVGYEAGLVRVEVSDAVWLRQMMSLRGVLERDIAKIAGLPVSGIHFETTGTSRQAAEPGSPRGSRPARRPKA
jgi:hypothetical protein